MPIVEPSRTEIANPTLEDVFELFRKTHVFRNNSKEADQKDTTLELLTSFAYYHGHNCLSTADRSLLDKYQKKKVPEHRGFHQIFGPARLPDLVPDFLTFMAYEIAPVASQKFVQTTCRDLEDLCLWMLREGYLDLDPGEEAAYRCAQAGRNLPRAMRALKLLFREAQRFSSEEVRWTADGESEKYIIARLAPTQLWLEDDSGERIGPLAAGHKIKTNLEVGWIIHCSLGKEAGQWKITGLGGIFPYPP
jgi:hypothetical protein